MNKKPFVSIIIPFYVNVPRFFTDLKRFKKLNYKNYEILVVTDNKQVKINQAKVRVIFTGIKNTGPAEKRDIAIKKAKGSICAFIDDDAYPDKDWITNALKLFKGEKLAAIGGPGVTPKEDGFFEQITGLIYESFFCSGLAQYRFMKAKSRYVDDYPAYNLFVRTNVLKKIKGYGSHFYGGEDTFLCLKMVNAGYKIFYSPKVLVYHHRRPLFTPYLKQIANIGLHRGYFAKKFPETSRRFMYFLPSIFTIITAFCIFISIFSAYRLTLLLSTFFLTIIFLSFSINTKKGIIVRLIAGVGIILTHFVYGIYFIKGIFTTELKK